MSLLGKILKELIYTVHIDREIISKDNIQILLRLVIYSYKVFFNAKSQFENVLNKPLPPKRADHVAGEKLICLWPLDCSGYYQ